MSLRVAKQIVLNYQERVNSTKYKSKLPALLWSLQIEQGTEYKGQQTEIILTKAFQVLLDPISKQELKESQCMLHLHSIEITRPEF